MHCCDWQCGSFCQTPLTGLHAQDWDARNEGEGV